VLADQTLVGTNRAGRQKFGDQRSEGRSDPVDLAQAAFGCHLFERLRRTSHAARRAPIGAQPMALFAGDFQALGDLLEESRDDQVRSTRSGQVG
jgi:hypothetical protein